jgi:hypothetical protein
VDLKSEPEVWQRKKEMPSQLATNPSIASHLGSRCKSLNSMRE